MMSNNMVADNSTGISDNIDDDDYYGDNSNDDNDNGILWNRITDLEHQVQLQQDQLMCLRFTAAETLRRLNGLEQSLLVSNNNSTTSTITTTTSDSLMQTSTSSSVSRIFQSTSTPTSTSTSTSNDKKPSQKRSISRSVYNLHSTILKNQLINGNSLYSTDENGNQTVSNESLINGTNTSMQANSRSGRYVRRNVEKSDSQNQPKDSKTVAAVRMKKWLSSVDVKCNKGQQRDQLAKNGKVGTSTADLSNFKSTNKFGRTSNLSISQRSISRFGLEHREPSFQSDKGILQVFVNGKTVHLPISNSINDLDLSSELDAPSCEPTLNWVYGYRGKDCRGNLYELPTGEIIYFAGTIVILHNPNEGLQRYYTKHTSDIKWITYNEQVSELQSSSTVLIINDLLFVAEIIDLKKIMNSKSFSFFIMAIHPNKLHIATGQTSRRFLEKSGFNIHRSPISSITELNNILETDQYKAHVRIWDSVTLQTLRTIGTGNASANFDRGVQCCAFSHAAANGMQLAVVDDSYEHILSVWEWQKEKKIAEIKSANDQVFACEFHPNSKNVLISYGKGHCNLWTITGTTLTKKPITFQGRNKPKLVLCSHFTERGHIITGDSNGTLTIWHISQIKPIQQVPKAHNGGVWALCLLGNGHFISAGRDRLLFEWETNGLIKIRGPIAFPNEGNDLIRTIASTPTSHLLIGTTRNAIWSGTLDDGFQRIQQAHADFVTNIAAHPTKPQFLTSSTDNKLRLFDTEAKTILWSLHFKDGICCVDFHPEGDTFAIGFASGTWAIYNYMNRTQIYAFEEESDSDITAVRFSTTGNFLAVATDKKKLLIYAISGDFRHYVKVSEITELNASIRKIDWSTDGTLLRANDNKLQHYIWNSSTGQPATVQEVSLVNWASASCPVSFENACISYYSLKSVASIDRSPDGRYVAVALSNGTLRFYHYPTTTLLASYKEISGYSISTRNVSFVGKLLISDGSNDGTIYQWKLSKYQV